MKYLDYITSMVNASISDVFNCERKQMLGLAKAIRKTDSTTTDARPKIVPGIYEGLGKDVTYAGFDDRYSLCTYHKAVSMTTRLSPTGYGHEQGRLLMTHNLSFILCADTDALGMNEDQLAMSLQLQFPDNVQRDDLPNGFFAVTFLVSGIVLNAEQIFREEYQNVSYFLGPQHALIKVNYTVESTISKRCFNTTCQPSN